MELTPGLWTFLLTLGIAAGVVAQPGGIAAFAWLYDHFVPLLSAALAMCTFQAVFVYANSYISGELLAYQGNSGNFFYDVSTPPATLTPVLDGPPAQPHLARLPEL